MILSSLELQSIGKVNKRKIAIDIFKAELEMAYYLHWIGIGILDYPEIVKYPMDLGTVKDKLKDNMYHHIEDVLDEI